MKTMNMPCSLSFLLIAFLACADDRLDMALRQLLDGSLDPSGITAEKRIPLVVQLRRLVQSAEGSQQQQAKSALVNLGDTQTVHQVLQDLGGTSAVDRKAASRILAQECRNPDLLPALAEALFLDEKPGMELINGEFLLPRRSTVAADGIRNILALSSSFPLATREWASGLRDRDAGTVRATIRVWWTNNAAHIQARAYERTVVQPYSANTATKMAPDGQAASTP